jgi:ubiquinone/menaquinone biosynthesis C-methylase UbiE
VLAVLAVVASSTAYRGINTIRRLEVVEAERDQWQRADEVVRALDVGAGAVVVDLGCGAGYFALKLSRLVGPQGRVLAVDVRRLPLLFLRARALLQYRHNVTVVRGDTEDPHLPAVTVDAVLIANTYHELSDPRAILDRSFRALRGGGRLVIVDPGPEGSHESADHHETPEAAEARLRQSGFEIDRRNDRFIDRGSDGTWWLIVARKPYS